MMHPSTTLVLSHYAEALSAMAEYHTAHRCLENVFHSLPYDEQQFVIKECKEFGIELPIDKTKE